MKFTGNYKIIAAALGLIASLGLVGSCTSASATGTRAAAAAVPTLELVCPAVDHPVVGQTVTCTYRGVAPPSTTDPTTTTKPSTTDPTTTTKPTTTTPSTPAPGPGEVKIASAYVTGYSWYDNTPPGSAAISHPVLHKTAGGVGTYADPVTVAVGHDKSSGKDVLDYPAGTKFYMPFAQRYFIVEDSCGDGGSPQNGPCHSLSQADRGATTWLDIWVDGKSASRSVSDKCMSDLSKLHNVIKNPAADYKVATGSGVIHDGTCDIGHGETATK